MELGSGTVHGSGAGRNGIVDFAVVEVDRCSAQKGDEECVPLLTADGVRIVGAWGYASPGCRQDSDLALEAKDIRRSRHDGIEHAGPKSRRRSARVLDDGGHAVGEIFLPP